MHPAPSQVEIPKVAYVLLISRRLTGVMVEVDGCYPTMWRVRQGERLSDVVNLAWARDAAITWARPRGLGGGEIARWRKIAGAVMDGGERATCRGVV